MTAADRIRAHTVVDHAPLVPELDLHLITDECPLWHASEARTIEAGVPEPFWAFAWPGGQALARYVLDHPELVEGRRVLDVGSGSALEALAALLVGAKEAVAADLDPLAAEAARLNAALNGIDGLVTSVEDFIGRPVDADVVLAGDVFYDRELAARGREWMIDVARQGIPVLVGDPLRGFLDTSGFEPVATYRTCPDGEVRGKRTRETVVYRVVG